MKTILLLLLFALFSLSLFSDVNLIAENFSGYPTLPSGWTKTGPTTTNWSSVGTNLAGGTTGELHFSYTPQGTGTYRLISPAFDTRKVHDMAVSFRYMLDDFTTSNNYTIGVQISGDLTNWTDLWSVTGSSDIAANYITVPFSFRLGKSETTYIAFYFTGNTYDMDNWYIDDISLFYVNTLGSGTWEADTYNPVGSVIVPDGYTLVLSPDVRINFSDSHALIVDGNLIVNGTLGHEVILIASTTSWEGIDIMTFDPANDSTLIDHAIIEQSTSSGLSTYYNKVRVSNTKFRNNRSISHGGGIDLHGSAIIENCNISACVSDYFGAAIQCTECSPVLRYNMIHENISGLDAGSSILGFNTCNVSNVYSNSIVDNYISTSSHAVLCASSNGDFTYNLIANNDGPGMCTLGGEIHIKHCDVINNADEGLDAYWPTYVESSIFWGNDGSEIVSATAYLYVHYSCIQGGISGIGGSGVTAGHYSNLVTGNPLFVNPTTGIGPMYHAQFSDWSLQCNSPCVDAGNPFVMYNPDGSIEDIGVFYRLLKPIITGAADVTPDQGHQIDLQWNRNDADVTFSANSFYSVWRLGTSRSGNDVLISNPAQISYGMQTVENNMYLRDGDRRWYYIEQIPAVNDPDYGLIVPTLRDSSSIGLNEEIFIVRYHNNLGVWASMPFAGFSVDNIPPDSAERLALAHTGTNRFNVSWLPVTEGHWEGNSYPETNQITYKIYAGDSPDFAISPANLLILTTNPSAVLNSQTADNKFYKIVTSDSE